MTKNQNNPLYKIGTVSKLAELLFSDKKEFVKLCDKKNYKPFLQKKHNSDDFRIVEPPSKRLKQVQKRINSFLQKADISPYLQSGVRGKCFVDNAIKHLLNKYVLCVDIKSFYPSTSNQNVFQCFKYDFLIPDDISWVLTDLTTCSNEYITESHLPTGAPTSVLLAFLGYKKTFDEIYQKAKEYNIEMSVYIDDLTFSSTNKIPHEFYNFVEKRMKDVGLILKKNKTKWYSPEDFKKITGVVISPECKGLVPLKNIVKIKKILNKKNIKDLNETKMLSLRGSLNSARQIEPNFYDTLYKRVCKIIKQNNWGYKPTRKKTYENGLLKLQKENF